jgi:hypothetical protein
LLLAKNNGFCGTGINSCNWPIADRSTFHVSEITHKFSTTALCRYVLDQFFWLTGWFWFIQSHFNYLGYIASNFRMLCEWWIGRNVFVASFTVTSYIPLEGLNTTMKILTLAGFLCDTLDTGRLLVVW